MGYDAGLHRIARLTKCRPDFSAWLGPATGLVGSAGVSVEGREIQPTEKSVADFCRTLQSYDTRGSLD